MTQTQTVETKVAEAQADYPVSVNLHGHEFRTTNNVLKAVFELFENEANWKLPIKKAVPSIVVDKAIEPAFKGFDPISAGALRSAFVAQAIQYFVGGTPSVTYHDDAIDGKIYVVVKSAGYYNNIGA